MRPRADEVMQSIIWTFDEHILPNVEGAFPKSLALSISNQLRHVLLRMEREGPALVEDNAELREVLKGIGGYVSSLQPAPASLQKLQGALSDAAKGSPVNGYVSLLALTGEADALRTLLDTALKALQEHRATLRGDTKYNAVRDRIRDYLNHQIERQSLWIKEAFTIERR